MHETEQGMTKRMKETAKDTLDLQQNHGKMMIIIIIIIITMINIKTDRDTYYIDEFVHASITRLSEYSKDNISFPIINSSMHEQNLDKLLQDQSLIDAFEHHPIHQWLSCYSM